MAKKTTPMTASQLQRRMLDRIQAKLIAGDDLSPTEIRTLQEATAAEQAAAQQPADPWAELVAAIRDRQAKGKALPKHLVEAAREAEQLRLSEHIWAKPGDVAAAFDVSPQTVRNWREAGCPIADSQIPQAPVYRWLWERDRRRLEEARAKADTNPLDDALKQARLDERTRRLVDEAEDIARAGVVRTLTQVRQSLTQSLPGRITDDLGEQLSDPGTAQHRIRETIIALLDEQRFRSAREEGTDT